MQLADFSEVVIRPDIEDYESPTPSLFQCLQKYSRPLTAAMAILITIYLFWNTGIHSDDYSAISAAKGGNFWDFVSIDPKKRSSTLAFLPAYYSFWWAYQFLNQELLWAYDVVKWTMHVLSVWLVYRFATGYLPKDRASLAALLFIFNPVHDATEYWYMTVPYVLTPALIMFAHCMVREGHYAKGMAIGILGSFMTYASPPYSFGLSIIFLVEKSYKKAVIFLVPGVLYVIYYFSIAALFPSVEHRLDHSLSLGTLGKNYVLQILTFADSAVGPSFLVKIWWATSTIGFVSLVLAAVVVLYAALYFRSERGCISISMLWGLIAVLLLSFGMLSLTGQFTQMAFNLGNRITVYGSLLIAFLMASLPRSRALLAAIAVLFVVPAFGLSDHWKAWNEQQRNVIRAIKANPDLARLNRSDILLVSGNMYSRLGPFSHIEFFSQPWVVRTIFKDVVNSDNVKGLPPYVYIDGKFLVDPKFGERVEITRSTYLYNSMEDKLVGVSSDELPDILAKRPREIRHWIQLIGNGSIHSAILQLNPRLDYLFK